MSGEPKPGAGGGPEPHKKGQGGHTGLEDANVSKIPFEKQPAVEEPLESTAPTDAPAAPATGGDTPAM